ncbi:MAG: ATP synthase F1 subunit gamma [Candidatus Gracilibacteria bacterium]|nr:ATP synthase F1 subunit gamma [Candidatus Gracilibacteria bacterium]
MATGKEIKRRIKSIKNTSKITKAMELISTVKMKKAQDLALEKKEYIRGILEVFMNINGHFSESIYFNKESNSSKTLGIVITSNKGLCGGYNINVMKKVNEYVKSNRTDIDFISLGKRGSQFLARTGNNIVADFSDHFGDNINLIFSKSVSRMILEKFSTGNYKKVVVFYNYYVNTIRQIPISRELLPLTDVSIEKYFRDILGDDFKYSDNKNDESAYLVEPSLHDLLEEVLPMLVDSMFFDILIESKASEHSSRMIAMKNAKDNANKFASKLVLQYNKARQAAITKEISEIVSGVESMKE